MNFLIVICVLVCVLVCVVCGAIARHIEKRNFNSGICPICNQKLYHFGTDSQGGRGYSCNNCNYITWVSYNIDKLYLQKTL